MLRSLKWSVLRFVGRHGYQVIPNWRLTEGGLGLHLKRLFEVEKIDFVVDVGANQGQYHDFLREFVGYRGLIASFEPNMDLVSLLQDRARKDPSWRIFGVALGPTEGPSNFNVMEDRQFSSFLLPDNVATSSFSTQNRVAETRAVQMTTLDTAYYDLQRQFGFRRPYLKLDTQGYDLEVVKGAGAVLQEFKALQTEASVKPIYKQMPDYRTTIATMQARGFELSGMFSVTDECFPLLVEFDCVMVNSRVVTTSL